LFRASGEESHHFMVERTTYLIDLCALVFLGKKTAITLWALTGFFGSLALVISNAPYHLERTFMYIGALIWVVLIAFFLRQRDE